MSRHIHLEPVGGVAGDMFVAAMLDLLPECVTSCLDDLQDCGVMQHVNVALVPGLCKGLSVKRLQVALTDPLAQRTGKYRDLQAWLAASALQDDVKQRAQSILLSIAEAEAYVHGVDVEQVHFHEIADWDSIVDVVAAASVIERAGISGWSCAALPLGSGLVKTAHGLLPVPAPATAWLLKGLNVRDDGEPGERVTPTGAAIVRHVLGISGGEMAHSIHPPEGCLSSVGCGAGQRELQQRPNVLRCLLLEKVGISSESVQQFPYRPLPVMGQIVDAVIELSFDIDDMTPEELSVSLDLIRCNPGVLDAGFHLAMGKKGRPVFTVNVLCHPDAESAVSTCCLEETTTLGIRIQLIHRRTLERRQQTVDGEHGSAGVKSVTRPSGAVSAKVESDDLADLPGLAARRKEASRLRERFES
ncbi:MAG: LarC family nickel insertion protein [Granulosicoccus sp.]|nr:LarC family nickel insertion protein [Granulosicoccus sp.]